MFIFFYNMNFSKPDSLPPFSLSHRITKSDSLSLLDPRSICSFLSLGSVQKVLGKRVSATRVVCTYPTVEQWGEVTLELSDFQSNRLYS